MTSTLSTGCPLTTAKTRSCDVIREIVIPAPPDSNHFHYSNIVSSLQEPIVDEFPDLPIKPCQDSTTFSHTDSSQE